MSDTIKTITSQPIKPASREFTNNNKTNLPQQKNLKGNTSVFSRFNDKNLASLLSIIKELVDTLQDYVGNKNYQSNDNPQQGTAGNDYLSGTNADDDINGQDGNDRILAHLSNSMIIFSFKTVVYVFLTVIMALQL